MQLQAAIAAAQSAMLADLATLVECESPSSEPAPLARSADIVAEIEQCGP
jgi:hypothetical protein